MAYQYRSLPCSIEPDNKLWSIVGYDTKTGMGGVLEWCHSEEDATSLIPIMEQDKGRFRNLRAEKWKKN